MVTVLVLSGMRHHCRVNPRAAQNPEAGISSMRVFTTRITFGGAHLLCFGGVLKLASSAGGLQSFCKRPPRMSPGFVAMFTRALHGHELGERHSVRPAGRSSAGVKARVAWHASCHCRSTAMRAPLNPLLY